MWRQKWEQLEYGASTISLQAAVYPEHTLRALNMKEEEEPEVRQIHNQ